MSVKVAVGVLRDSGKFSGHRYRAHRAVIFAVAQLSCFLLIFVLAMCGRLWPLYLSIFSAYIMLYRDESCKFALL